MGASDSLIESVAATDNHILRASPPQIREAVRSRQISKQSRGMAPGYVQVSIVVLEREDAYDFLVFCQRNPKPCPILEVLDEGCYESTYLAPGADVRTDLPKYRVYRNGEVEAEVTSIVDYWRPTLVTFLMGCAITFDDALSRAGVSNRHLQFGSGGSMYITNIPLRPSGRFAGPLVVSMRPMPALEAIRAIQVTTRFQRTHGEPVHIGDPGAIGIADITKPDFGWPVPVYPGEVPVFWACAVTTQNVAIQAKLGFVITQAPGCMMVTDMRADEIALF